MKPVSKMLKKELVAEVKSLRKDMQAYQDLLRVSKRDLSIEVDAHRSSKKQWADDVQRRIKYTILYSQLSWWTRVRKNSASTLNYLRIGKF